MVNFTDYHEEVIMDRSFRGIDAPPAPPTLYVGLHTDHPTETGQANEVTAPEYDRQPLTTAEWTGEGSTVENSAVVEYSRATTDWGQIRYVSLWNGDEADAAADALWFAELDTYKGPIEAGDQLRFNIGTLLFEAN